MAFGKKKNQEVGVDPWEEKKAEVKDKISEEKKHLSTVYRDIGKMFYAEMKDGNPPEQYVQLFTDVDGTLEQIEHYKQEIDALESVVICPRCHARCSSDAVFCFNCGYKLENASSATGSAAVCSECGAPILPDAMFCTNCGHKVK